MLRRRSACIGAILFCSATPLIVAQTATADYQCGNQKDDCKCGGNNPYPCCSNGSNCTWWAWESACCNWKVALPGWGNANTWASYASKNGNYQVLGDPVPGSIATSTKGNYGHVAWVESVNGNKITVTEMNCCGSCPYGVRKWSYDKSYFNSGYVIKKGLPPPGPVCPNGKCEGGENCANCPNDCGSCCGNAQCDNGENCTTCAKDCGACCGNGQCDNGETCATCAKDCVCLPQGQLEQATCSAVAGWAIDPDTPTPVPVTLHEAGMTLAKGVANLNHPKHDGHGFWWATPAGLKDGKPHEMTVHAQDDNHPQAATLGPSAFLCSTGPIASAQWQSKQVEHSGIAVLIPEAEGWTIRHDHAATNPYPLAGKVTSCLSPLMGQFDEGYATLAYSFGAQPFAAEVKLDGVSLGQFLAIGDTRLEFGQGQTLCLETVALKEIAVPAEAHVQLGPVHVRTGPWWWTATPLATGWRAGLRQPDGIDVRGEGTLRGAIRAEHNVLEPFDQVQWTSQPEELPDGVHMRLRVGITEIAADAPGHHVTNGLWGQELAIQVWADGEVAATSAMRAQMLDLRAHQTGMRTQGPWRVEQLGSYGLSADVTPHSADDGGMQVVLNHHPPGWWTTGAVRAATEVTLAPIERVRANIAADFKALQVAGLILELQVGRKPLWNSTMLPDGAPTPFALDAPVAEPAKSSEIAWILTSKTDQWDLPSRAAQISGMRWRAGGWWSYPSADVQGWVDLRPEGGVRIETRQVLVAGKLAIERVLPFVASGVRFRYRQNLLPIEATVRLRLDGKVVREFSEVGPAFQNFELPGPCQRVTLDMQTNADAVALSGVATADVGTPLRFAEITAVTVKGPAGQWVGVDSLPDDPAQVGTVDAKGDGVGAAGAAVPARQSGGCTARGGAELPVAAALVAGALAILRRRRQC